MKHRPLVSMHQYMQLRTTCMYALHAYCMCVTASLAMQSPHLFTASFYICECAYACAHTCECVCVCVHTCGWVWGNECTVVALLVCMHACLHSFYLVVESVDPLSRKRNSSKPPFAHHDTPSSSALRTTCLPDAPPPPPPPHSYLHTHTPNPCICLILL